MPEEREQPTRVTWIQNLLDRRVPQILGLYLGGSWGMIQFVEWLAERYGLAQNLPEIALATTLSLIPAATILAYFHGHPGRVVGSHWTRVEKIGIPVNAILTGLLLISVAGSGEADAATQTITLTDETGQQIERVLPKQEYLRRLAIFGFDNEAEDPDLAWLEDGIITALTLDLLQDLFLDARTTLSTTDFRAKVRGAGFTSGAGMPLALQRKITRELHLPYFLRGSFRKSGDAYTIKTAAYDAERGKLLGENEVEGADLMALIDRLAVQLKHDLGLSEEHIENATDLPAAEIVTRSPAALEYLGRAAQAMLYERKYDAATDLLEQAMAADPSFALAAYILAQTCEARNDRECTLNYLEVAMEHLYKLPERFKFEVKSSYYFHTEEHEKRLRLAEMRIEIFPQDIDGYLNLADIYAKRTEWELALEQYHRALEIAPEPELHFRTISRIYFKQGNVERARDYIERYVEHFSDDAESYVIQGRFFEELSDHEAARTSYEKALLLDPGKTSVLLDLGDVERNLGHVEVAAEHYAKALARSKRPEDKAAVYGRLEKLHRVRGEIGRAMEYHELAWQVREKVLAPRSYALQRLFVAHRYVQAGREEAAWKLVEELEPRLKPPLDQLVAISYLRIYNELGDVAKAEEELVKLEAAFEALGDLINNLRPFILYSRGQILEAKGDFAAAIESYREALEVDHSNQEFHLALGRAQRKAGRYKEALERLEKALAAFSFDPEVHYELGLTYAGLGDDQARENMQRAVEMWSGADPGYEPALEARARLAELDAAA